MNMMHNILAAHAASQLRDLSPPDRGSLTDAEVNSVQAEVELRASQECDECTEKFQDWLNSEPGYRTRQDYAQWRAAMLTEDEQIEIEQQLGMRT